MSDADVSLRLTGGEAYEFVNYSPLSYINYLGTPLGGNRSFAGDKGYKKFSKFPVYKK